jgi:hypothetical protein
MSLKLSNFSQYLQISDDIDYLECRLGEQYVIPFTFSAGDPPVALDISAWTFSMDSEVYSATFNYRADGSLASVENFESVGPKSTPAGLQVILTNAAAGQGALIIPATVNPDPNQLIWPDRANTMLNILTITMEYPSSVVGINHIRKSLIGLIVRLGA